MLTSATVKRLLTAAGSADLAFLIDVVTDVDVADGHHAVIGRDDRFEPNQCLEVPDVLLRGLDLRRFGFRLGYLHRDRLLGDRMVFAQRHPALRGEVGERILGALRLQIRLGLRILGVESRRVDFGEDIALLHQRAVILVPHLHIARDLRVDRRLETRPEYCRGA